MTPAGCTRTWRTGGAVLLLLVAILGVWFWSGRHARASQWQTVWKRDFTAAGADPSCFKTVEMPGRFAGVEAQGQAGVLLHNRQLFWLDEAASPGEVRLTVEVEWPYTVDNLELHVNARRSGAIDKVETPPGFSAHVGASLGIRSYLSVTWPGERNQPSRLASPDLQPGRTYVLSLTHAGGQLALAIDGQEILRQEILLPPRGADFRSFGLRPSSDVLVKRLTIEQLKVSGEAGPLLAGDTLLAGDDPAQAAAVFLQIADQHAGQSLAEEALARAVLASCKMRVKDAWRQPLERLQTGFPTSPLLQPCIETVAISHWAGGEQVQALDQAEAILQRFPDSMIAAALLHRRLYAMPGGQDVSVVNVIQPAELARLLGLLKRTRNLVFLDLANLSISDLSPLRGMPLRFLNIQSNPLSDLAPLAGMPLIELNASYTKVNSLEPLRGMQLQALRVENAPIDDASPLVGMPLRCLSLSTGPAFAVASLRGIAPIELSLYELPIDVLPDLDYTRMTSLDVHRTGIADLASLRSARRLINVNLEYTQVADISPLREAPLQRLSTSRTRVRDLSPLSGARLRFYDADDSPLESVRPLAGMPLRTLRLNATQVSDLSTLDLSAIDWLTLDGSKVTDLAPLRGTPLRGLSIVRTAIEDFDPIAGMPNLRNLNFTPAKDRIHFWNSLVEKLQTEGRKELARSIGQRMAWESGDAQQMRRWAEPWQGRLRFDTHIRTDFASARATAQRLGARLPCLRDGEDEARLLALLGPDWQRCWLGLDVESGGGLVWSDGGQVAWNRMPASIPRLADPAWFVTFNRHGIVWSQVSAASEHITCNLVLEWDQAGK